jgi:hypothetical protein
VVAQISADAGSPTFGAAGAGAPAGDRRLARADVVGCHVGRAGRVRAGGACLARGRRHVRAAGGLLDGLARTVRPPGRAVLAGAGAVLAVTVTARLGWCTAATLAARARAGRSHRRGLRAAGRADAQLGAIVIDHAQPAAYCLSGPRQPVVLTSAALSALDDA